MRRLIPFAIAVFSLAMIVRPADCQLSPVTEAAARELIDVMVGEGGSDAAAELAEMGGETAVRNLLERAASEGGEELVGRVRQYGTRYGPPALKAVERAPARMIRALDGIPPDLVGAAVGAAARDPGVTARLVAVYGKDALELEAKQPGVGASLVEKLGGNGITIGTQLTTDQAVQLARYADDIRTLPVGERSQLLGAMAKAPAAVLDFLETHPKSLLTAGGVAAVIAARDNLFGGNGTATYQGSPPAGFVERIMFGFADGFARPLIVVVMILGVFSVCGAAIRLRSVWKHNRCCLAARSVRTRHRDPRTVKSD